MGRRDCLGSIDRSFFSFGQRPKITNSTAGLTARSVFVLDERDHIIYRELVAELSSEPNYAAALAAAAGVAPLKVTVFGSGVVGQALSTGFAKFGHTVKIVSSRDASKLAGAQRKANDLFFSSLSMHRS